MSDTPEVTNYGPQNEPFKPTYKDANGLDYQIDGDGKRKYVVLSSAESARQIVPPLPASSNEFGAGLSDPPYSTVGGHAWSEVLTPKDPEAFDSWVREVAGTAFGEGKEPVVLTPVDEAWAKIEHRVGWIKEQLSTQTGDSLRNKRHRSYIKNAALVLSMRSVLATLDSLSELIPT